MTQWMQKEQTAKKGVDEPSVIRRTVTRLSPVSLQTRKVASCPPNNVVTM